MDRPAAPSSAPAHASKLSLFDTVSVIIAIVIGAGIYETVPLVLSNASSPAAALGFWVAGGALSLAGAACYGELAAAYPRSGGDYVYLSRAFGPAVGFLFGWAQLTVIMTGSIGMMAYVFADYAVSMWGGGAAAASILAAASVIVLTATNATSVAAGKRAQNLLSVLKVAGVAAIVITGLVLAVGPARPNAAAAAAAGGTGSIGLAMIFVLYTFGGWNDAAFVAAEVKRPGRNMPRALLLGMVIITGIYVAMNAAFIWGLGFEGARASRAVAADLLRAAFGPLGGTAMAVIVMVSALGAVSALIFTGARLHASVGAEHPAMAGLSKWHPRLGIPLASLAAQLVVTLALMGLVGTAVGRGLVEGAVTGLGFSAPVWSGHGGFDTLLRCTAPVFWVFFLLTGLSLFVLRWRDPDRPRPFRVPGYPVVPIVFCLTCAYMVQAAVAYAGALSLIGLAPVVIGLPVYWLSERERSAPSSAASYSPSFTAGERNES